MQDTNKSTKEYLEECISVYRKKGIDFQKSTNSQRVEIDAIKIMETGLLQDNKVFHKVCFENLDSSIRFFQVYKECKIEDFKETKEYNLLVSNPFFCVNYLLDRKIDIPEMVKVIIHGYPNLESISCSCYYSEKIRNQFSIRLCEKLFGKDSRFKFLEKTEFSNRYKNLKKA